MSINKFPIYMILEGAELGEAGRKAIKYKKPVVSDHHGFFR